MIEEPKNPLCRIEGWYSPGGGFWSVEMRACRVGDDYSHGDSEQEDIAYLRGMLLEYVGREFDKAAEVFLARDRGNDL